MCLLSLFFFPLYFFISWRLITLQHCSGFCQSLSCVWLFETPWTVTQQASLSMEFLRQDYLSELPFSSSVNLLSLGIEPTSHALAGEFFTTGPPGKLWSCYSNRLKVEMQLWIHAADFCGVHAQGVVMKYVPLLNFSLQTASAIAAQKSAMFTKWWA